MPLISRMEKLENLDERLFKRETLPSISELVPMPIPIPGVFSFSCMQLAQSAASDLTLKEVFWQMHCRIIPPCEPIMPAVLL